MDYTVHFKFERNDRSSIAEFSIPNAVIPAKKTTVNFENKHYGKVTDVQHRYMSKGQTIDDQPVFNHEVFVTVDSGW